MVCAERWNNRHTEQSHTHSHSQSQQGYEIKWKSNYSNDLIWWSHEGRTVELTFTDFLEGMGVNTHLDQLLHISVDVRPPVYLNNSALHIWKVHESAFIYKHRRFCGCIHPWISWYPTQSKDLCFIVLGCFHFIESLCLNDCSYICQLSFAIILTRFLIWRFWW